MARIYLIHWNADEIRARADRLREHGHDVECEAASGAAIGPSLRTNPPDVVVIDLGRLPSHGKHMAVWLREHKATRHVPIVFVDGDPAKVEGVRQTFPDAAYTTWRGIRGAITRAVASPPKDPVVVRSAGYSGTPLPKKLGVKPDSTLALLGAPDDFRTTLGALPDGVRVVTSARGSCDVLVVFATRAADLSRRFAAGQRCLAEGGGLWLAWPKRAAGVPTDLTETVVRELGLASGLVDNKVCAIDATWSGLRFMRRRR
jgi:hypothetical protein